MVTGTSVAESVPLHVDSCGDCQLHHRPPSGGGLRGPREDTARTRIALYPSNPTMPSFGSARAWRSGTAARPPTPGGLTANPFTAQAREIRQRRSGNLRPRHPWHHHQAGRTRRPPGGGARSGGQSSPNVRPTRMHPEPERRRRLACRRTSTKLNRHGPTTGRTDCRCGGKADR